MTPMLRFAAILVLASSMAEAQDSDFELPPPPKSVSNKEIPKAATAAKSYSFPRQDVDDFDPAAQLANQPYCARYIDGAKSLVFLAARHNDKENTIPMVDKLFAVKPGPQVVIVERDDDQIKNAELIARYAAEGEAEHALELAGKKTLPRGGTPKPYEQLALFLGLKTFDVQDFEGFYVIRTITAERSRRFKSYYDSGEFAGLVEKVVGEFKGEFSNGSGAPLFKGSDLFTTAAFQKWYLDKNKKALDFTTLKEEETWPAKNSTLFSRQVAAGTSRVRDYFLGERIAAALNSHDRVLVIYGGGHHVEMARALKTMLGRPKLPLSQTPEGCAAVPP